MECERRDKKKLIINSAIKLFYEGGYINTKVEDITKDAGVAKGTFYTYFKSKDDLIYNIVKTTILKYEKNNRKLNYDNDNFRILMRKIIKSKIKFAIENEKIFIILIGALFNSTNVNKEMRELLIEKNNKISRKIGDIIEIGISKNEINFRFESKVNEISNMINSLINVHMGKIFINEDIVKSNKNSKPKDKLDKLEFKSTKEDVDKETDFILDFILNGILQ